MGSWPLARQAEDARRERELLRLPARAAAHHVRLEAPRSDLELVTASPGADGDVYALWSSRTATGQSRARTTEPGGPVVAMVTTHGSTQRVVTVLRDLRLPHPKVQPLPEGQVVLVGARAEWRPTGPEQNAIVVDADGETLYSGTLGDGIAHVQTTPSGRIWVGYHDEGVFGNYGWGRPGPAPIGRSGLVCFGPDLRQQWEFPSFDNPWGSIDDCYAMNVVEETAWSCYYSDFPVVRADGHRVAGWRNRVAGAAALVVGEDWVALAGGYGPDRARLVTGRLVRDSFEVVSENRLTLPNEVALPRGATLTGRGPDLFVIVARDCYRLSVA